MASAEAGGAVSKSAPEAMAANGSRPNAAHSRADKDGTGTAAGSNHSARPLASASSHKAAASPP